LWPVFSAFVIVCDPWGSPFVLLLSSVFPTRCLCLRFCIQCKRYNKQNKLSASRFLLPWWCFIQRKQIKINYSKIKSIRALRLFYYQGFTFLACRRWIQFRWSHDRSESSLYYVQQKRIASKLSFFCVGPVCAVG
jgi:hypothetical protein